MRCKAENGIRFATGLSEKARRTINKAVQAESVFISSISAWEVVMLVKRQRLVLTLDVHEWINTSAALPFVHFVPVGNDITVGAVNLPEPLHNDPADRIIAATARVLDVPLITRDRRLIDYPGVKTVW
jgi:PIN domain nuclease of toxin-antitoxin system